jgi:hypothetical protein
MNKILSFLLFAFSLNVSAFNYDLSKIDTLMTVDKLSSFVNQVNSKQVILIKNSSQFGNEISLFLNNNPDYTDRFILVTQQRNYKYDIKLKNEFPDIVFTSVFINEFNSLMNNSTFLESNQDNIYYLVLALSRINFAFYEHTINNSCYKTYLDDEDIYIPSKEINKKNISCKLNYLSF